MKHVSQEALVCLGVAFGLVLMPVLALSLPAHEPPKKPVTNDEIKTMLLETQRNQAQLAAMFLYVEGNLRNDIKRLERKPPLLPEVR